MSFSLAEIQAFVAVVRCGTFTAAAAQVNITQPALSRRIQLIEQALGAPVFERLPTGPRLTDTGQQFLPHAEAALMALEEGLDAARGTVRGDRGRVSLAAIGALCTEELVHALRQFRDDIPDADLLLSFHANTSNAVSEIVLQGEAVWGLRFRPDSRLHSEVIGHENLLIVCSPNHKLAHEKSVSAAILNDETWISYPLGAGHAGSAFWSTMSFFGIHGRRVMLTDSTTAQKRLIEADFGVGLLPQGSVRTEIRERKLSVIDVDFPTTSVPIVLVRRNGAYVSKISERLGRQIAAAYQTSAPSPDRTR